MDAEIIKKLQETTFFRGLTKTQITSICNRSKLLSFDKSDLIFYQGSEARAFFLIISGWVAIVKENETAEESILHVFKDGDSFAEPAAIIFKRYPANAYAISPCKILKIDVSILKSKILHDPDIAMRLIARLSEQLNTLINAFEQYKTMNVSLRLARFLLDLLKHSTDKNVIDLPFNKTILATQFGVQPGTLSRAFNTLRKHGVRSDHSNRIIIEDCDKLERYVVKAVK